jgi:mono/diheme cytochrome c family protein
VVGKNKGGDDGPELTDIGLHHSTGWLHSYIEDPTRFHRDSKMAAFGPPVLSHQEIEEVARYLGTLQGPPGSGSQPEVADTFPEPPKHGGGARGRDSVEKMQANPKHD